MAPPLTETASKPVHENREGRSFGPYHSNLIDFCLLAITSLPGHFILILAQVKTENLGSSHLSMKDSDGLQDSAKRMSRAFQPIVNRADATTTSLRPQDFQTNGRFIVLRKAQHHFVALPLHLAMDGSWNSQY